MDRWGGDQLLSEMERLGARGLPYGVLHAELNAQIRRAFPVDGLLARLGPGGTVALRVDMIARQEIFRLAVARSRQTAAPSD